MKQQEQQQKRKKKLHDDKHNPAILFTLRQKSIRALEIFRVQKLILNATSRNESLASHDL